MSVVVGLTGGWRAGGRRTDDGSIASDSSFCGGAVRYRLLLIMMKMGTCEYCIDVE